MAFGIADDGFEENSVYESSFLTTVRPHLFVTGAHTHLGLNLIIACHQAGFHVHTVCCNRKQVNTLNRLGCLSVVLGDATNPPPHSGFHKCTFAVHYAAGYINSENCRTAEFLARCARHVNKVVVVSSCTVLLDGHATPVCNARERDTIPGNQTWSEQYGGNTNPNKGNSMFSIPSQTVEALRNAEIAALEHSPKVIIVRPALMWGGFGDPLTTDLTLAAMSGRLRLLNRGLFDTSTCHVSNACAGIMCALRVSREENGLAARSSVYFLTDGDDDDNDDEDSDSATNNNNIDASLHNNNEPSSTNQVYYIHRRHNGPQRHSTERSKRYCDFVRAVLESVQVPKKEIENALSRSLPLWLARRLMQLTRWTFRPCLSIVSRFAFLSPLKQSLSSAYASMCDSAVCRMGTEITVCDRLARSVLGYRNVVSVREGIEMLRYSTPLQLSGTKR